MTLTIIITLLVIWWLTATFLLSGPNLSHFDGAVGEHFDDHPDDAKATANTLELVRNVRRDVKKSKSLKKSMHIVREFADNLSEGLETDTIFTAGKANGVSVEWAVAPTADTKRRLLFLHGGAFLFGSPKGHRKFCDQLSKLANAAVLSVDYRMLPENSRMKSIEDSQLAYHWLLSNGPNGPEALDTLIVAGDSAGGNLALMLSSWSKDNADRKPDAVIAFSPSTDMTLTSPTIKAHRHSDKLLGEGLGLISKLPSPMRAWSGLFSMRINPANPLASPVFGDLHDLPPTLIHVSSNEMLLGEATRYANRAIAAGSPVKMQIWKDQMHDWHLFNMGYGSANSAWAEVEKFINDVASN